MSGFIGGLHGIDSVVVNYPTVPILTNSFESQQLLKPKLVAQMINPCLAVTTAYVSGNRPKIKLEGFHSCRYHKDTAGSVIQRTLQRYPLGRHVLGSEPIEKNMLGGFRSLAPTLGLTGRDCIQMYSHKGFNYIIKQTVWVWCCRHFFYRRHVKVLLPLTI